MGKHNGMGPCNPLLVEVLLLLLTGLILLGLKLKTKSFRPMFNL